MAVRPPRPPRSHCHPSRNGATGSATVDTTPGSSPSRGGGSGGSVGGAMAHSGPPSGTANLGQRHGRSRPHPHPPGPPGCGQLPTPRRSRHRRAGARQRRRRGTVDLTRCCPCRSHLPCSGRGLTPEHGRRHHPAVSDAPDGRRSRCLPAGAPPSAHTRWSPRRGLPGLTAAARRAGSTDDGGRRPVLQAGPAVSWPAAAVSR